MTSKPFELLYAKCEMRGLVYVDLPQDSTGAVYYDRDPTWQHEVVSGVLVREVTTQLSEMGGNFCCLFVLAQAGIGNKANTT